MLGTRDESRAPWSAFAVVSNLEYSGPRDATNVYWAFFSIDLGSTSKINAVQKKRKKKVSRDVSQVMHLESFSCGCCRSAAAAIPAAATVPAGVDKGSGDGRCGK